jgi:acyl-CoA oxidase
MESTNNNFILLNDQIVNLIETDKLFCKEQDLTFNYEMYRDITFRRLKKIIDLQIIDANSMLTNPDMFFSVMNTLHLYDASLAIKTGVNFGLFGGALLKYGEPSQIKSYLTKLNRGEIFGCLAITEIGHGSNLKGLETTATYDPSRDGFIINSPTTLSMLPSENKTKKRQVELEKLERLRLSTSPGRSRTLGAMLPSSTKCWIGNAACHGTHAVVFAQLFLSNKLIGLHPFLVKIRNRKTNQVIEGITLTDNGPKKGLNGVDNGMIRFDNVFVKKNKLLRNFGYIDDQGKYCQGSEKYSNDGARFGALLSTLSGGRGVLAYGSNLMSFKALHIALSYAQIRRQFNLDDINFKEKPIIEYATHQIKLIPLLAKSIVLQNALSEIKKLAIEDLNMANENDQMLVSANVMQKTMPSIKKRIHIFSSGLKILCSEHAEECCRTSRILCGANGYSIKNELAQMHNDIDIYQTFEGDNTLLRQEISKHVLSLSFNKNNKNQFQQLLKIMSFRIEKKLNTIKSYITVFDFNKTEHILWLLKYRTKYLAHEIVSELIFRTKNGCYAQEHNLPLQGQGSSSDAWNYCLPNIMLLADAFMYKKIYEINMRQFVGPNLDKVAQGSPDCAHNLTMFHLFAYQLLDTNSSWYLVNNLISSSDVLNIQKKITKLSKDLSEKNTLTDVLRMLKIPLVFSDVPMVRNLS